MARGLFEEAYLSLPPWDIGRPQGEIIRLAEEGEIRGAVLDAGCGGVFVLISLAYNLLWYTAVKDRALLRSGVPEQVIRKFTRNYRLGFPLYLLATAAAFVSPYYTIGICMLIGVQN